VSAVVGVGIDAVDIDRFRLLLARRPKMADRLFSPAEQELALRRSDPLPTLAARFAAKEAVMKALSTGLGRRLRRHRGPVQPRWGAEAVGVWTSLGAGALARDHELARVAVPHAHAGDGHRRGRLTASTESRR